MRGCTKKTVTRSLKSEHMAHNLREKEVGSRDWPSWKCNMKNNNIGMLTKYTGLELSKFSITVDTIYVSGDDI